MWRESQSGSGLSADRTQLVFSYGPSRHKRAKEGIGWVCRLSCSDDSIDDSDSKHHSLPGCGSRSRYRLEIDPRCAFARSMPSRRCCSERMAWQCRHTPRIDEASSTGVRARVASYFRCKCGLM